MGDAGTLGSFAGARQMSGRGEGRGAGGGSEKRKSEGGSEAEDCRARSGRPEGNSGFPLLETALPPS